LSRSLKVCNPRSVCLFFSSRRRHTRWPRDWSSDVCSSDLRALTWPSKADEVSNKDKRRVALEGRVRAREGNLAEPHEQNFHENRSEERRVGKECRSLWGPY